MPAPTDSFTLYLRGPDGAQLRKILEPFGRGGDLERWKLNNVDAEVIHTGAAQVALIRVRYDNDPPAVYRLIRELHAAAHRAGVVLSDDVNSDKSADALIAAFGVEGVRVDRLRAGKPSNRWSMTKKIVVWTLGAGLLALVYGLYRALGAIADTFMQGR
jgi:hypothetical protein